MLALVVLIVVIQAHAQVETALQSFKRGQLWHSVSLGKIGPNFNNWAQRGIGLDWPAFEESWVAEDVGGSPSYLATGGFWIGAKKRDSTGLNVLSVEDWSIYASTVSNEPNSKYKVTQHRMKHKNGANYWLKTNPNEGEEVIETTWEYNLNYSAIDDRERQLPIRVNRTLHQWSGSRRDENYIITEYVFKNISPELRAAGRTTVPDTLFGFRLLLSYAMHTNSRASRVLFSSLAPGAPNTWHFYDPARRMLFGRAGDYAPTPPAVANESFGFSKTQGRVRNGQPSGEFLAHGIVGVRLLYSSPDSTGIATRVNGFGWSAASTIDLSGPFTSIGTDNAKYAVLENPQRAANPVNSSFDTVYMQKARMWGMMSLGPWTILPGDSIRIALAEIVDGADYKFALDSATIARFEISRFGGTGAGQGIQIFNRAADKAKFTYDQRLRSGSLDHPDPPAAPKFTVDFDNRRPGFVANVISWGKETEGLPDPDDNTDDLVGYKIYRSDYLPIGPWDSIATIRRGDTQFFDAATNTYRFVDNSVIFGTNYYYALTAYDTGKASWPPNPSAFFPETGSNRVPPLESSIFANRLVFPFKATIPATPTAKEIVVVPNPFVLKEGSAQPGSGDDILIANIPSPCTIRIYTIRGDRVTTINHPAGAGGATTWNQVTDFGQFAESGVYVLHVESTAGNKITKFAIIR